MAELLFAVELIPGVKGAERDHIPAVRWSDRMMAVLDQVDDQGETADILIDLAERLLRIERGDKGEDE